MVTDQWLLEMESRKCFEFFWNETNIDESSKGFGLIRDRAPGGDGIASIASVGFGLSAIVIGVERGWTTYEDGHKRVNGTLNTLLNNVPEEKGFFYHFLNMKDGKRAYRSEVSIIDTAIVVCGALTAGEYFGGEIRKKAENIYKRVNWKWFLDLKRNQFYMGYSPETGFAGWWDFYAEQLMTYFLAAGSPTNPVSGDVFYGFQRNYTTYGSYSTFINSWFGSLFTHQFSHAWFDLRYMEDKDGIDWWKNSVTGSLVNRQFCIDNSSKFKTFNENSWGLTACDGPYGYCGLYGSAPSAIYNNEHRNDGTVPPCGAAGSIVFTPEYSIEALKYYYEKHPELWGKYGFKDAYNIEVTPKWYGDDVIGIDKGITLIMIENYRTEFIWNLFMKNEYVNLGLEKTGMKRMEQEEAS